MSAATVLSRSLPIVERGFEFRETMSGHHCPVEGPQKGTKLPFAFSCRASAESLAAFLDPTSPDHRLKVRLEGELDAEGLAKKAPFENGQLEFHPMAKEGVMIYTFDFHGVDGRPYAFRGLKNRQGLNLAKGLTTLYGTVKDKQTGAKVSEGVSYFDLKDLKAFIQSYKLI